MKAAATERQAAQVSTPNVFKAVPASRPLEREPVARACSVGHYCCAGIVQSGAKRHHKNPLLVWE